MSNTGYHNIYYKDEKVVEEKQIIDIGLAYDSAYSYNLDNWDFAKDDYIVKPKPRKTYKYLIRKVSDYINLRKELTIPKIYDLFCNGNINFHIPNNEINYCLEVIERLVQYNGDLAGEYRENPDFKMRLNWFINKKRKLFLRTDSWDYVCLHQMIEHLEKYYGYRF